MFPRLDLLGEHGRGIHHILVQSVASIFVRYDPLDSSLRCHIYHAILRPLCHEMECEYYYILTFERVLQEFGVRVLTFMDRHGGREGGGRIGARDYRDLEVMRSFQQVFEDNAAYLAACLLFPISFADGAMSAWNPRRLW